MEDATQRFADALDKDRLCRWHAALFPTGASGLRRIRVGEYRDHADPMQIVSGPTGTRDMAQLVQQDLPFTRGQGKALRYFVNVPGWAHPDRS